MAKVLDEAGLAELWSLVKEHAIKYSFGTYVGTNTYGKDNPTTLTFDFEPKIIFISSKANNNTSSGASSDLYVLRNYGIANASDGFGGNDTADVRIYFNFGGNANNYYCYLLEWGTTVKWCNTDSAGYQLNGSGSTYYYIALG